MVVLAAVGGAASCARPPRHAIERGDAEPARPEGTSRSESTPAVAAAVRRLRVSASIICGPRPEGDADFDALAAMGVRAVISVEGAAPDVARAAARGMRSVHLPTGFGGLSAQRQAGIARAVRDLRGERGAVYIYDRRGTDRGPAAAASAAILLGELTVEEGLRVMDAAGTGRHYPGLWSSVREIGTLPAWIVDRAPATPPERAPVPAFVGAMVHIDEAVGRLEAIRDAGWGPPPEGSGRVAAEEAGRLADLLRGLRHDARARKEGSEFIFFLLASAERAKELEGALAAGSSTDRLESAMTALGTSCRDCHVRYRD